MSTKQGAIRDLYMAGWDGVAIAQMLKLSPKTVSKHVTTLQLKQKRIQQDIAQKTSQENVLTVLEYQTRILVLIKENLEAGLNDSPTIEELRAALVPKGEIDAIQKMSTMIKGKEVEWTSLVKIIREFTTWLKDQDMRLAQEIVDHAHTYINEKRSLMS